MSFEESARTWKSKGDQMHSPHIICFGNCQAQLTVEGMARSRPSANTEMFLLASTSTHIFPGDHAAFLQSFPQLPNELKPELFLSRGLENQFAFTTGSADPKLDRIVLTLFHDATPLFRHKTTGVVFYLNEAEVKRFESLGQLGSEIADWLAAHCEKVEDQGETYWERYSRFLSLVRERYPATPILLLLRCRHLAAYDPTPYSYLADWGSLQNELDEVVARFQRDYGPISVLELDSVVGGYVRGTGVSISRVFPTVLLNPQVSKEAKGRDQVWRMKRVCERDFNSLLQRDVEHPCEEVWNRVSALVAEWSETGKIGHPESERPLDANFAAPLGCFEDLHTQRSRLTAATGVLDWQIFFENLVYTLPEDRSEILNGLGAVAPQDKYLLRAVRAYALLNPELPVLRFLEDYLATLGPSRKGNRDSRVVAETIERVKRAMAINLSPRSVN